MSIPNKYLKQLSELLADGHRNFGKVAPRRPYSEEDDTGDGGTGTALFEPHPLFFDQPRGASSDLTFVTTDNKYSMEEAEKRSDQASPQLTKQLNLSLKLGKKHVAVPSPYSV